MNEELRTKIVMVCFENCAPISQEQCDKYNKEYSDPCAQCGADQIIALLPNEDEIRKDERERIIRYLDKRLGFDYSGIRTQEIREGK